MGHTKNGFNHACDTKKNGFNHAWDTQKNGFNHTWDTKKKFGTQKKMVSIMHGTQKKTGFNHAWETKKPVLITHGRQKKWF